MSDDTIHSIASMMLDTAIKSNEWDEMPMVFLMTEPAEGDPNPYALMILAVSGQHPAEMMEAMAAAASRGLIPDEKIPKTKLLGIALQTEAWGLRANTKADGKAMMAWTGSGRSIADHPDGVELKMTTSYDGEQFRSQQFERGSENKTDLPPEGMTGRVPDAMRAMFHAMNTRIETLREQGPRT